MVQYPTGREIFIDNLFVRIHFIIVMIRWTGLAPWGLNSLVQIALHLPSYTPSLREFTIPWREAGPANDLDDRVNSDQQVVNEELPLCCLPCSLLPFFYSLLVTPHFLLATFYSLLPTPCSLHPTSDSLLPTPYARLPTPNTLLSTPYSLLPTPCSLLPTPCFRLPTPYSLLSTPYALLPTPYFRLPTPYGRLPTVDSLRPTPYFLLPTRYSLLPTPYSLNAHRRLRIFLSSSLLSLQVLESP